MTDPEIGDLVRKAREKRKISIAVIARILKIPKSSLSRFERGERGLSLENRQRLLDYFSITREWIPRKKVEKQIHCPNCCHRFPMSVLKLK